MAPPDDPITRGVVVLVPGTTASQGGKTPAITASQTRQIVTRLLRHPAPSPEEIAEEITRVLRRNEESRIDHWHAKTGTFPPRRSQTDSN
jgi:hypothetical protein